MGKLQKEGLNEEKWVLRNIGKKCCTFTYPEKEDGKTLVMKGILKDRVAFLTKSITQITQFIDVIDLIEFEFKKKKTTAIRFGYYRKSSDEKWRWGSQTTLTEDIDILKALFRKAVKEKSWFKQFLTDVLS